MCQNYLQSFLVVVLKIHYKAVVESLNMFCRSSAVCHAVSWKGKRRSLNCKQTTTPYALVRRCMCHSQVRHTHLMSYSMCMDRQARLRKLRIDLIERDYGDTAQQVLDLCALVAEAESNSSQVELDQFLKEVGTNRMVWRRLFSISQDKRLPGLIDKLPSSYTALYALTNFSDQELEAGIKEGVITADSSSRQILEWVKQFRVGIGLDENKAEVLYLRVDPNQSKEQTQSLLDALVAVADDHGALLVTDSEQLTKRYTVAQKRTDAGKVLREELVAEVRVIFPLIKEYDRNRLRIGSIGELVDADLSAFGQFLTTAAGSRTKMLEQYGSTYCKKITFEYTQSKDRSQRFNYKRRLLQCQTLIPDAVQCIDELLTKFVL